MVTVKNPVETTYSIALSNHGAQRAKLMESATTGLKQDITVVDSILGAKAKSDANLGGKIITGMGTGFSIISTATTVLKNIRDQLDSIKQELATLSNADAQALDIAQNDYRNQVLRIITTLRTTNFAGKNLFDGTLAATVVANSGTPGGSGPLQVQAGINAGDVVNITIARLLSGDASNGAGTAGSDPAAVAGAFQPLFGVFDGGAGTSSRLAVTAARVMQQAAIAGGQNNAAITGAVVAGDALSAAIKAAAVKASADALAAGNADGSAGWKTIVVNAAVDTAAAYSAGDVTTPGGRAAATQSLDAKINILDGVISNLTGEENALSAAKANLEDLVKNLHTAADNYLSTDYEKVIPELTKLLREDRVASLAFGLSERAINAIISQMEGVAATAA